MLYLIGICLGILIIMVTIKLLRSPRFDKFCNEITSGKLADDSTTKESIREISKVEKELTDKQRENLKISLGLKEDSETIKDYLGKRGLIKNNDEEKKEDSE